MILTYGRVPGVLSLKVEKYAVVETLCVSLRMFVRLRECVYLLYV